MDASPHSPLAARSLAAAGAERAWPSTRWAWYMIAVLMLAYILSFVDRMIFGLLIAPIRAEFAINDTVFSLLYGWGFAFFYTILGVPLGRAADRFNRRNIVIVGIAVWSVMTVACGLAKSFYQLALARIAVGVGEASLSPATYSMAADSFPSHRLGRALSVFVIGWPLGIGAALIIGSLVIQAVAQDSYYQLPLFGTVKSWQACFIVVGMPGLLLALLLLTVREPDRRGATTPAADSTFRATLRHLRRNWIAYASLTLGFSMISIVMNTYQLWGVQHFVRVHGFPTARAGLWVGTVIAVCGTLGVLAGGFLHDRLRSAGHADAAHKVGLLAALAMLPSTALSTLVASPELAIALMLPIGFFTSFGFGASGAAILMLTPKHMHATVSAIYLFFLNIIAMGLGPLLTARLNDAVFRSELAVGKSIAIVASGALLLAATLFVVGAPHVRRAAATCERGNTAS